LREAGPTFFSEDKQHASGFGIFAAKKPQSGKREGVLEDLPARSRLLQQVIPPNLGYAVLSGSNNDGPSCEAGSSLFSEDNASAKTFGKSQSFISFPFTL
jgi:hypothetical protein